MEIKKINGDFSICKVPDLSFVHVESEYCFIGKTDEEISVVCRTEHVPQNAVEREDGWKAFRIQGVLDFSLIGVLSGISAILAEQQIGIFVLSTYNTDYILTKSENYSSAVSSLKRAGCSFSYVCIAKSRSRKKLDCFSVSAFTAVWRYAVTVPPCRCADLAGRRR